MIFGSCTVRLHMKIGSVDLAILVGQYCMPTVGEYAFDIDCRYVRIDPEGGDIGRNLPIDLGIIANERAALEDLNAQPDIIEFKKVFNGRVDIKSVLSEE